MMVEEGRFVNGEWSWADEVHPEKANSIECRGWQQMLECLIHSAVTNGGIDMLWFWY